MKGQEIAKFFSGFEAFHTLLHAYLRLAGTTLTVFGIMATPTWNVAGVILNGSIALALGIYGWRQYEHRSA